MATKKFTIIFPPGDVFTSVVWEKEKETKVVDLLSRLCQLRGLSLDSLKAYNDQGKKVKEPILQQTVEQTGLVFIELVDKESKKEKREKKAKKEQKKEEADHIVKGIPKGIADKIVPGSYCKLGLREQLFDHEWEALQKFKEKYSEISALYSDEFLMSCLFARKLDLERSHALLQNNLKFRKEKGLMNIPKMSEVDLRAMDPFMGIPGGRSKDGNGVIYLNMGESVPGQEPYTVPTLSKWMAWFNYVGIFAEGMDFFRNGLYLVCDMNDFGWKNFDTEYNKATASLWSDIFPGRPKKFLLLNEPIVFTAIFKLMKTFMKAKIADRFEPVDQKDLPSLIDKSNLLVKFGGSYNYTKEQYMECFRNFCAANEERLIAPGRTN